MKSTVLEKEIEKCRRDKEWCVERRRYFIERLKIVEITYWTWFGIDFIQIILHVLKYVGKIESTILITSLTLILIYIWFERRKLIKKIDALYLEGDPKMDDSWTRLAMIITILITGILILLLT